MARRRLHGGPGCAALALNPIVVDDSDVERAAAPGLELRCVHDRPINRNRPKKREVAPTYEQNGLTHEKYHSVLL